MKKFLILSLLFAIFISCPGNCMPSRLPIIGITPSFSDNTVRINYDFVSAITENGGIAIVLTPTIDEKIIKQYVEMLDGAVFSGGPDIPPEFYGQTQHHTTKTMEPLRFEFEKRFIKAFLESGKPALGVCLGMQFSNVIYGGTMFQDIPELIGKKVQHRNGKMYTNYHPVGIAKGSLLANTLGTLKAQVNSRHHQAVQKTGELFKVVARSSDGVIEALERKDGKFGIFVQWHPESMRDRDPQHRSRLFAALVNACRKAKK